MKLSEICTLSAIGVVTVVSEVSRCQNCHDFSHDRVGVWLAKFCSFLTIFIKSVKTPKYRVFMIFLKTDKIQKFGSLLAVFLAVLTRDKTVKTVNS